MLLGLKINFNGELENEVASFIALEVGTVLLARKIN